MKNDKIELVDCYDKYSNKIIGEKCEDIVYWEDNLIVLFPVILFLMGGFMMVLYP